MKKVDITNDEEMVTEGLRLPVRSKRDESVWTKTQAEKEALKKVRTSSYFVGSKPVGYNVGTKHSLAVYVKGAKKSTVSFNCYINEVVPIIRRYKDTLLGFCYNGKKYASIADFPDVYLNRQMRYR